MKAITREEKIISGENLTPITRKEMFLAKASGQNIQTPTPITREEYFLSKITGGGGSVEGTAIPVGVPVEKIYFNTALSVEETNAYLSQLTYVDIGFGTPINILYAQTSDGNEGTIILARRVEGGYSINIVGNVSEGKSDAVFVGGANGIGWSSHRLENVTDTVYCHFNMIDIVNISPVLTNFNGLPIGAENEKIKNVLSITPFGA
jgi:hypothetical protein